MKYVDRECITQHEPLNGENLVYVMVLLIFHITLWELMWKLNIVSYRVFLLLIIPATLLAGIISALYSIGVRKGLIREPSKQNEKKLVLVLVSSVVISASLILFSMTL